MAKFQVPLIANVPATSSVEIEAESLQAACQKVEADLDANGLITIAAEPEFEAQWERDSMPAIDDVLLPDGNMYSSQRRTS